MEQILITFVVSGVIGYIVGSLKSIRENKLQKYGEMLPKIVAYAYKSEHTSDETKDFNTWINQASLYANRDSFLKLMKVTQTLTQKGNQDHSLTEAMQAAIVTMRKDLNPWWLRYCNRLEPKEITHLQFRG